MGKQRLRVGRTSAFISSTHRRIVCGLPGTSSSDISIHPSGRDPEKTAKIPDALLQNRAILFSNAAFVHDKVPPIVMVKPFQMVSTTDAAANFFSALAPEAEK